MTLPKSIRGLACLHPRGTAPQPHLARGARGAAGGAAGGRREPGVARAGRREGRLQAEPPSLPGQAWRRKEGRREGGGRGGKEGESRRVSLPTSGTPAMEGRREVPPAPRSPPRPRGGRGWGARGRRPRPWGGMGSRSTFSTAPLPSLASSPSFFSSSLSPAARRAPSPAPLRSPRLPQKRP